MRNYINYLAGTLLIGVAFPAISQPRGPYDHGHMWNFGGWFMGPVFMLLLLVAIFFVLKQTGGLGQDSLINHKDAPLETLKMRYAQGEIDEEEYELRRKTLES